MFTTELLVVLALGSIVAGAAPICPFGLTELSAFNDDDGSAWLACEDLQVPDGGIALVPSVPGAKIEWLPKTREPYTQGADDTYYLGMGKDAALRAAGTGDVLGRALLSCNHSSSPSTSCFSWRDVAAALPPIRRSGPGGHWDNWEACAGVRTFVGSRASSADATFSDYGEDCSHNGFPSPLGQLLPGYSVINGTAVHRGEGAILNWTRYINFSAVADGLVGGHLPVLAMYFPVLADNPYHSPTRDGAGAASDRYWTMVAAPVPDPGGRREQDVWFRFTQVDCARATGACTGYSQYWQNYWWSRQPGEENGAFGPRVSSSAAGFYSNLLRVQKYWRAELQAEGMMQVSLPGAGGGDDDHGTNGTWLSQQATHSIVRSMITRRDTWHPAYGVSPGYGWRGQDGFQDTFTSTVTMALEWGMFPYARGVVDNQFSFYVRAEDGMVNYRATEIPTTSRFLTLLAQYYSYTRDASLLMKHFNKARKLATWLEYRRNLTLGFPRDDPRYGIPYGDDEADTYAHVGGFSGLGKWQGMAPRLHHLSSAAEMSRGFLEMGRVWITVGEAHGRADMIAHGRALLATAPLLLHDLHASLNATVSLARGKGGRGRAEAGQCWAHQAEADCDLRIRTYPELLYSATLRDGQVDDIYKMGTGEVDCTGARNCSSGWRFLQVGCPAGGALLFTHIPFGLAYGLLVADFPERFLLHYYAASAHSYTRGSWTTPESAQLDRDHPSIAYASPGTAIAPLYLRWLLAFEDPRSQTLWLAKATPREWLAAGQQALMARDVPTRYGRVNVTLAAERTPPGEQYRVRATVELPVDCAPPGGVRLRVRAPLSKGKMSAVTVGGEMWPAFSTEAETVDFTAAAMTPTVLNGMKSGILVTFS